MVPIDGPVNEMVIAFDTSDRELDRRSGRITG